MNIHSVRMRSNSPARRLTAVRAPAPPGDKRDLILKAATKVFAQNGYFNSQVADVARVAGVAAGTVYLYFKSKDDLLVSIFERSMNEVLGEARAAIDGVADPAAAAAEDCPAASRTARPRQGSGRGVPGGAAPVGQVHGAFLGDVPAGLLQADPPGDRRWAAGRRVPQRHQRDDLDEDFLRRARRNGHQLGVEPPQVPICKPKPTRSSTCSSMESNAGEPDDQLR